MPNGGTGTASLTDTFRTHPDRYRHWRLEIDGPVATLMLEVDPSAPYEPGYELKLNSYDLAVDLELHDAVQRLRFEHPEVGAVVITGGLDKVFCAGANIGMLAQASHPAKVNFCKFTNETRLAIEDASTHSAQTYICALNGTASGGGYELALACDRIILVDDGSSAVSLPELPLLAVLPGTGGLTRLVDKRMVRRDLADAFATRAEGVRGRQALGWGLVDELAPRSRFEDVVRERATELARPRADEGIELGPITGRHVTVELDAGQSTATVTVRGPSSPAFERSGLWWPIAAARELDDAILHLRFQEQEIATIILRTEGDPDTVVELDRTLAAGDDWLVRETVLLWKRVLKRLENTAKSIVALIEPGSCFAGTLLELALAADRSYMLDEDGGPVVSLTPMNFGPLPTANGLTRLESRHVEAAPGAHDAGRALELGLVTFAPDDLDWDDEVRLALEERASFSPDALTALEANLRFAGPETMETKIFGRLSAWQNWVFGRPNASSALRSYGTGVRPEFDGGRT